MNSIVRTSLLVSIGAVLIWVVVFLTNPFMRFVGVLLLLGLIWYLTLRTETSEGQLAELSRLRAAYDQLDQQAKLIIRTDLELHRTQEDLDRKLASLIALHELG